jgi:hypothetical protein
MTILDRYTITETLHEGATAALYRGMRKRDGSRSSSKRTEPSRPRRAISSGCAASTRSSDSLTART